MRQCGPGDEVAPVRATRTAADQRARFADGGALPVSALVVGGLVAGRPGAAWNLAQFYVDRSAEGGPRMLALACRDLETQMVSLRLDATTANIAIARHADKREAHVREVERFGQSLPEGSYGRRNR